MTDAVTDQVRALIKQLQHTRSSHEFTAFLNLAASGHESDGAAAVEALKHAYDALDDAFQALIASGYIADARAVKSVMDEVAAVSISINRLVIDYLDKAADVAAAKKTLDDAKADLDREAKRVKGDTSSLKDVSSALDVITQLVGL